MKYKYYIDLDVLSRRFDIERTTKVQREKIISESIHNLIENNSISCICSKPLKDETISCPHPIKRGWLFDLYRKSGFVDCVWTTEKMYALRDKLARKCRFEDDDLMDALHVTVAAMSKADFFVTFNKKHFISNNRKQCIEKFFKDVLGHNIIVDTPQCIPSLKQIGQF